MQIDNLDHSPSDKPAEGAPLRFPRRDLLRLAVGGGAGLALGAIVDLTAVSQACRRSGALLCVDMTQAAGWQPFDPGLADNVRQG